MPGAPPSIGARQPDWLGRDGERWAENKHTAIEDLGAKCRYHHHQKTHKGWRDGPRGEDGKRDLIPPQAPDQSDTPDPPLRT